MKNLKSIYQFLIGIMVCAILGNAIAPFIGVSSHVAFAGLVVIASIPRALPQGVLRAEQLVTLFTSDIQKNIFPQNAFYTKSKLDGGININAKTVDVPQSGSSATIQKNPSSFPLTISQRTDDTLQYNVDLFATEPIHVEDVNELVINYSKRADVLQEHVDALKTRIADEANFAWSAITAADIVRTSGANGGSLAPSATGFRKKVTKVDILGLRKRLNQQNVPMEGRMLLIDSLLESELFELEEFVSLEKIGAAKLATGAIGRILGFDVFVRSQTTIYDAQPTPQPKAVGAAGAATDNISALAWHPSWVRRAEGNVKVYSDTDKPEFLGSIANAAVRFGATKSRTDGKGCVSLVQEVGV